MFLGTSHHEQDNYYGCKQLSLEYRPHGELAAYSKDYIHHLLS